jgi:ABC-2 type transport system ATP-binding protein
MPHSRVDRLLELTGLADVARTRVGGFTPGLRRRLALATALLGEPRVLVLDEPTADLDPAGAGWLRGFVRDFAADGGTVLLTDDRITGLEGTVDRVVLLRAGCSVYQGGLEPLLDARRTRVLVACADAAALAIALAERGVTEIDALPDGRISVVGATPRQVGDTALEVRVAIYGMVEHSTGLEQVFGELVAGPARPAPVEPTVAPI